MRVRCREARAIEGRFAERTRARLQEEILDAAAEEVRVRGWRGLRMQVVADVVGVSRQTVHSEFATKRGLAGALVLRMTSAYLDEEEQLVRASPDLASALRSSVGFALDRARDDDLLRSALSVEGRETFLPLYTSDGAPLVHYISSRMAGAFGARWPELDDDRLTVAMTGVTRLVISHIVLPLEPPDEAAANITQPFVAFLHQQS